MSEIQPVNLLSAAPVGHNATLNLLKATHLAAVIEKVDAVTKRGEWMKRGRTEGWRSWGDKDTVKNLLQF